ncbi:TPM domain-containing protein [Flavobacterium piscisymbiosum]|uniref:TPM domain-containing protein n=1 Tax=Flavobacterium piscisymbiosum TaxID=2893753 RepID=A0ABS8MKY5_9FLAO|nr:TPM domain-containing protein [Flavobacterium sp. F-30]MCC9066147.1 TPM domain-containing protein [Flavobacterium sp. F-30]
MKKILLLITISFLLPNTFFGQSGKSVPQNPVTENAFSKSYSYVNDFEKILTSNQITTLNTTLKSSEKKSGHKIIVVTISSIKPYTNVPEYAYYLEKYLTDNLKLNPTILIVLSKELRQIQIQSNHKELNTLTQEETRNIISNFAIPEFKKGDFYKGLENAVNQIVKKLE